jgi:hypothetical protein
VTSSLGKRLSDQVNGDAGLECDPGANAAGGVAGWPFANLPAHNDDQAHLVARSLSYADAGATATEGDVPDAVVQGYPKGSGFLAWYPTSNGTPPGGGPVPVTDPSTLISDFSSLVQGAGAYGCGIESQLESWYRFLVQPDPYGSLVVDDKGLATWQGVDSELLRERKDFLRPDSLVAVIVLTDENDSEIDVRSLGGRGYDFMGGVWEPPKATSACQTDPGSPDCRSCSVDNSAPECAVPAGSKPPYQTYSAPNDWGFDPNLRHVHMKAKYGVDPQFPIQRYAIGLTSGVVPDRAGEYPPGWANYDLGNNDCTNPLFAAELPDGSDTSPSALCNLALGPRTKDLVYYAVIGGVPHELLHYVPGDAAKSTLSDDDWVRILGRGPASMTAPPTGSATDAGTYDYEGIDPHMIEDYRDRTTVNYPFATDSTLTLGPQSNGVVSMSPATSSTNQDPVSGREWITDQPGPDATGAIPADSHSVPVDRQFSCIFKLKETRDCTQPQNWDACDCPTKAGTLTHAQTPPLCDDQQPTLQVYAKAYPTTRELMVARMLAGHGIVASLCPIDPVDLGTADHPDPLYGYRPAVATLIDRLKASLGPQCVPEGLVPGAGTDQVPCLVLVTLPASSGGSCMQPNCDPGKGLSVPPEGVLTQFCKNANDPETRSVCVLQQLTPEASPNDFAGGSCATESADPGWCYVTSSPHCAQALVFSNDALPSGSLAYLQCLE